MFNYLFKNTPILILSTPIILSPSDPISGIFKIRPLQKKKNKMYTQKFAKVS